MSDPDHQGWMEDLVLLGVIVLGFLAPPVLTMVSARVPPIILSILLASGISALVYRFLGGIDSDSHLVWGRVRLSGSIAVLIVSAVLINRGLVTQIHPRPDDVFEPHPQTWIALSRNTGVPQPIRVHLMGFEETLQPSRSRPFRSNPLTIEGRGNHYRVAPERDPSFTYGRLSRDDLRDLETTVQIEPSLKHFVVTERLSAGTRGYDLDPLPFRLDTTRYHRGYSGFLLRDAKGRAIHRGSIYRRQARVVRWEGRLFLVSVVEVNHHPGGEVPPYAKFALGEILARVQHGS